MVKIDQQIREDHHKWCMIALKELNLIFTKNQIKYYLIEGSALGAVRHNSIIPWDDDIDIGIFLKDQEKVSLLLAKELSERFKWIDTRTDGSYPRFFGKIVHEGRGCIDVFPLIKTSSKKSGRRVQWVNRKILFKLYKAKLKYVNSMEIVGYKEKIKVIIARIISCFLRLETIINLVQKNEAMYEKQDFNFYYINLYGSYSLEKEIIKKEWIGEGKKVLFGGMLYPVFSDTHDYLSNLYGDYMTPPPIRERTFRHEEEF